MNLKEEKMHQYYQPILIGYALYKLMPHLLTLPINLVVEATLSDIGEINARRMAKGSKSIF
ncbi:MAG: hypothetical protein QNJ54_28585 [Prochloraceae cyanobacterium]|nr:hypothetical protein [Prochloraceae cyanobacterium]